MRTFREYVKQKRAENRISLRKFCSQIQFDPSNWSKIERGYSTPPKDRSVLEKISEVLNLKKGSDDYHLLFELAAIDFIPKGIMEDDKVVEKLPVFFRTLRGEAPTEKELELIIKTLKEG